MAENKVLVNKASDNSRICVDFVDLNVACPRDPYPILNIDRLINKSLGYKMMFHGCIFGVQPG